MFGTKHFLWGLQLDAWVVFFFTTKEGDRRSLGLARVDDAEGFDQPEWEDHVAC